MPLEERREGTVTPEEKKVFVTTRLIPPKDFMITKDDVTRHRPTRGCGGCRSCFYGVARQPHTEACRERFRSLMKEEMKVKNAEVRKEEFERKVEERKAKRDRRRKEKEDKEAQEEVKPEDVVAGAAKEEER